MLDGKNYIPLREGSPLENILFGNILYRNLYSKSNGKIKLYAVKDGNLNDGMKDAIRARARNSNLFIREEIRYFDLKPSTF